MTNTVNIQLPGITSTAQIKLYNTIGSLVFHQTILHQTTQIDISQLPAGVYYVQVETPQGRAVKKLVVE